MLDGHFPARKPVGGKRPGWSALGITEQDHETGKRIGI